MSRSAPPLLYPLLGLEPLFPALTAHCLHKQKVLCLETCRVRVRSFGCISTNIQLTLEQHGFELHRSSNMWIFFSKYIGNIFGDLLQFEKTDSLEISKRIKKVCHECIKYMYIFFLPYNFLNNIFFCLADFTVSIQHMIT